MRRTGLAGEGTPDAVIAQLLPIVESDLAHEAERLRDMDFAQFATIAPGRSTASNAEAIARFLDVSPAVAHDLAQTPHLFTD